MLRQWRPTSLLFSIHLFSSPVLKGLFHVSYCSCHEKLLNNRPTFPFLGGRVAVTYSRSGLWFVALHEEEQHSSYNSSWKPFVFDGARSRTRVCTCRSIYALGLRGSRGIPYFPWSLNDVTGNAWPGQLIAYLQQLSTVENRYAWNQFLFNPCFIFCFSQNVYIILHNCHTKYIICCIFSQHLNIYFALWIIRQLDYISISLIDF